MPQLKYTVRESSGFEAWPEGPYNLRILKASSGVSRNNNNPQLVIKFEAIDGPYEGKQLTQWITITEKSGFDLGPLLEAAIPGQYEVEQAEADSEGNKRNTYTFDPDDLVDKLVTTDITKYRDDSGVDRNRFKHREFQAEGTPVASEAAGGEAPPQDAPAQERTATQRRRVANA